MRGARRRRRRHRGTKTNALRLVPGEVYPVTPRGRQRFSHILVFRLAVEDDGGGAFRTVHRRAAPDLRMVLFEGLAALCAGNCDSGHWRLSQM
jgi:hypothetical protein